MSSVEIVIFSVVFFAPLAFAIFSTYSGWAFKDPRINYWTDLIMLFYGALTTLVVLALFFITLWNSFTTD